MGGLTAESYGMQPGGGSCVSLQPILRLPLRLGKPLFKLRSLLSGIGETAGTSVG